MDAVEPSSSRSKRQKIDKTGRLSALEKLKQLKGNKNKYEVENLDNVYDEVDEQEYNKTVLERQNEDWIVDDGNNGYVEDGREIFDDDLDNESIHEARKNKISGSRKKKKNDAKRKGNIQNMFMTMSSKKPLNDNLDDDNILGDLMSELKKDTPQKREKKELLPNIFHKGNIKCQTPAPVHTPIRTDNKQHTIEADNNKQNDIDEPMFDKPKKTSTDIHRQLSCEINEVSDIESSSQTFEINDELQSTTNSQLIEPAEDLNEYIEDMCEADFDSINMDAIENAALTSAAVSSDKPKEPDRLKKSEELPNAAKKTPITEEIDEIEACTEMFKQTWEQDFISETPQVEICLNDKELPLPLTKNSNDKDIFRFYWWDAHEDPYKQPGTVYLFGKVYVPSVKSYVSCCVTVKDVPRRIFLLPRTQVVSNATQGTDGSSNNTLRNVYEEFSEYTNKMGIKEFRSCRVTKNYAFDKKGTPKTADYLEVRYSARYPTMDPTYNGPSIERVFGTTVNALELLLIERNIKGPCWLDIEHPLPSGLQINWCNLKVNCQKMEYLSVSSESSEMPIPPLVVATLNLRIALNTKTQENEIVMAAILLHYKYQIDKEPPKPPFQQHYCLVTRPREIPWPRQARDYLSKVKYTKLITCDNESDLLEELLKIISDADPDLLVGNDCGFQFEVLAQRVINLKVSHWSKLGRLKRGVPPMIRGKLSLGHLLAGRPTCDIQTSAKELNLKVRSYDLPSLCMAVLKKSESECKEIKPSECLTFFTSIEKLESLIKFTMTETLHIISIMFELNVMPLALQITCIAGNILSRTLSAGRAERNEYLLLHAFHQKSYITPDKRISQKSTKTETGNNPRRKKAAYAGGLVLEPKKGFYDTLILLMDFNSLYPSIIQEYNLCFTTVPGAAYAELDDLTIPETDTESGVIPTEIRKLVESRIQVKALMKAPNLTPEAKMQYNIRQLALKLTANSMYGCLGANHCRFYAKGLAALVTSKGREILMNTKSLVEKLNYEVIYGDTDSIMINTNVLDYDEVFSVGKKIKQEINQLYRKVELDIDGVFRYLLLLQKKKYAAVSLTKLPDGKLEETQEYKGLDIVRRDWCQLACEIGRKILENLLCDHSHEKRLEQIFSILQNVAKAVRENEVPLSSLVITKQLSKNPDEYPDKKQAHVIVALRLNREGGRKWKAGDTVPYIICEDGTNKSATERVYHIDEFKKSDILKIDVNYYLLNQIFPIVLRICDPIEGVDDVLLAENLGLQGIYKPKRREQEEIHVPLMVNEDRFRDCEPLKFKCRNESCQEEIVIKNVLTEFATGRLFSLAMCPNEACKIAPWTYNKAIQNEVQLAIRNVINKYYGTSFECDNPVCTNSTKNFPLDYRSKYPECWVCNNGDMHKIYSEIKLYNQISFYLHLFDINQLNYKQLLSQCSREMISAYDALKECVDKTLRKNAYSIVDLNMLFANFTSHASRTKDKLQTDDNNFSDDSDMDLHRGETEDPE